MNRQNEYLQSVFNALAKNKGYDLGLMQEAYDNHNGLALETYFDELKGSPNYNNTYFASDSIDPLVGSYGLEKYVPNEKIAFNSALGIDYHNAVDGLMNNYDAEGIIKADDDLKNMWDYNKYVAPNNTTWQRGALANLLNKYNGNVQWVYSNLTGDPTSINAGYYDLKDPDLIDLLTYLNQNRRY